jgi:dTDP-glucose 4,6-dehydratase
MKEKRILVLGSSSFSGNAFEYSSLTQFANVFGASRSGLPNKVFDAAFKLRDSQNPNFVSFNLNDGIDEVIKLIDYKEINVVVNFAAQSMVAQSWENPEDWYEANVVSFSKLLNKLSSNSKLEKFIQFTTPEVYGSTSGWKKESFDFAPNTPYAVSRAAADWHLKSMYENFQFPVIFTRAANVFGEHQQLYRIVPRAILSALTGKKLPLQGGGKSIRSFIHIDDVSNALIRIIESGAVGESYHISTNRLVSIHELISIIAEQLGIPLEDLVENTPDRLGKDFAYQLDSTKIRDELDWKDRISLEEGIARTVVWVRENLDELRNLPADYVHRR